MIAVRVIGIDRDNEPRRFLLLTSLTADQVAGELLDTRWRYAALYSGGKRVGVVELDVPSRRRVWKPAA